MAKWAEPELTGRSVEQDALGGLDAQVDKSLWVKQGRLDHFPELLNLFLAAADVGVGHIGLLLDLHHGHGRVDFGREGNMDLVLVAVHAYAHTFFDIRGGDLIGQVDDKFCKLLDVDDVLGVVRVRVDDLCAPGHLKGLLALERLLVGGQVPKSGRTQPGVGLFDAGQLVDALGDLRDVLLHGLERLGVRSLTVGLEQLDVALVQSLEVLLLLILVVVLDATHVRAQVILAHDENVNKRIRKEVLLARF